MTTDASASTVMELREEIELNAEEQTAYNEAMASLSATPDDFVGLIPTLVSMDAALPASESEVRSIVRPRSSTSTTGDNDFYHTALETLQAYEKREAEFPAPAVASLLEHSLTAVPQDRRVCQHPFKKNDIVWVCRTCQADETCVLCHACFSQSQHEGHDVAFYHAQAGGCCDCGDPEGT